MIEPSFISSKLSGLNFLGFLGGLKFNSLPLKMDGWKMKFIFMGSQLFSGFVKLGGSVHKFHYKCLPILPTGKQRH